MGEPLKKVLIVDDDPDDRMIIREVLKSCDATVECYELQDGNGVLDFLRSDLSNILPSFILLDLNMPGKNGKEVLKELKGDLNFVSIPIIILTTTSSSKERKESYFLGANCFITKPHDFPSFRNILQAVISLYCSNKNLGKGSLKL